MTVSPPTSEYKEDKTALHFERYYRPLLSPADWSRLMATLQTKLPTTFRVNGSPAAAAAFLAAMRARFFDRIAAVTVGAHTVRPPAPIAWVPDASAWRYDASKELLTRSPAFAELHGFLVAATDAGAITRQEEVSMIPAHFLNVQPHHAVIDMCACKSQRPLLLLGCPLLILFCLAHPAPGSKTLQLLSAMHAQDRTGLEEGKAPFMPSGENERRSLSGFVSNGPYLQVWWWPTK